jgi:hypothetical protein
VIRRATRAGPAWPRDESLVFTDHIENVPEEYRQVGTAILMENDRGQTGSFIVTRVDDETPTVDGNNPLCGREVVFRLEILTVRDAPDEEMKAGGAIGAERLCRASRCVRITGRGREADQPASEGGALNRTNVFFMFTLAGLVAIIMITVLLQSPADWWLILGAGGFSLFTFAWIGMYFRLRRELPDHALVNATYLNLGIGIGRERRAGFYNMVRLIRLHIERHRVDLWSILGVAGVAIFAASAIGYAATH